MNRRSLLAAGLSAPLVLGACGKPARAPAVIDKGTFGPPLETNPPNAKDYRPAFPGQTRAPSHTTGAAFKVETFAEGLEQPWSIEFLPDGRLLAAERPGRLRIISADGKLSQPGTGLPAVDHRGQGGLHDIALDPGYPAEPYLYFSYAEPRPQGGNGTTLARGRLRTDGARPRLEDVQVIFRQTPALDSNLHFGSRIVFARDGTLFLTLGERSILEGRVQAQDLNSHLGKVIRINRDGSVPKDNPFVGRPGVRPEIWSYGHRNVQGAAINPRTGVLWTVEHGPMGGDEINIPQAGRNYGWPVIGYGLEYSGEKIGEGITAREGMEQPIYYWDPVIAPSGMTFYTGDAFPAWRNSVFIGGLLSSKLVRLQLDGDKVVGEEWLVRDLKERVRDVKQGPDGAIYLITDESLVTDDTFGRVVRLRPT